FLKFYRDRADNYYVSGNTTGTVRINVQMEAPASYFGGAIDPSLQVRDLKRSLRPSLPASVQQAAERAIAHINPPTQGTFKEQLEALVTYFRGFEAREFPTDAISENIYLDLTLNKIGVCRHRSFAFVVTAQAMGILARYIYNEAHAFVEVKVPRGGWLRIDLGGAAANFEVHNSSDKMLHSPPEPDTLPQPEGYSQSYSHNIGNGQHEADVDADGDRELIEGVPESMSGNGTRLGPQDEPQGEDPSLSSEPYADGPPAEMTFPSPDGEAPAPPTTRPRAVRQSTITSFIQAQPRPGPDVFRGEHLTIEGKLTSAQGAPLANKTVEAFLAPKGDYRVEAFISVGKGQTDAQGRVMIDAQLPKTLALGRWSIYLYYRGDGGLAPSHSL
ncbi:MAG: transglutaminase domain-containing protein, partial [Myxococcota bacterium]